VYGALDSAAKHPKHENSTEIAVNEQTADLAWRLLRRVADQIAGQSKEE
jgi:hypothetical protein